MIALLITMPFLFGVISFYIRHDEMRRGMMLVCAGMHLALSGFVLIKGGGVFLSGWFQFDSVSVVFLMITSTLFFGSVLYGIQYLADEKRHLADEQKRHERFSQEAVFTGCFLLFLSMMTIVIASQQLALLWVGIEATTLASAPLIYFHRTRRSLEATWKYLLICSVGIAIALLGVFFLAVSNNNRGEMLLMQLLESARRNELDLQWLKAAFLLLFVGYGTKMGLAPMHTWLPDAHSEAPSVVSALLSGALLNCAFLGILRTYQICAAAGLASYCQDIFIFFGLLSVFFAAVFILGQTDYKRMLAYSSVEHMGIIILGIGLGGNAATGSLINLVGHSLTKAALFFTAGNILSYSHTKQIPAIRGLMIGETRRLGVLWMTGFLLITGTPPSGIFLGKFMVLKEMLFSGKYWTSVLFLFALALVFLGMARIFISMTQGYKSVEEGMEKPAAGLRFYIPALFFILVVAMGIYFPNWFTVILDKAVEELGGF
ncbi:MAG: proton-conducting transporter membrane subunit [Candidatus Omnitrophota bacterium]